MDEPDSGFNAPIRINYTAPWWLKWYLVFSVTGAVLCVYFADIAWHFRGCILLVALFCLYRRDLFLLRQPDIEVILDQHDRWKLVEAGKAAETVSLIQACIPVAGLVTVELKSRMGKRYTLLLSASNLDTTTLRRLRVRLYYPKNRSE